MFITVAAKIAFDVIQILSKAMKWERVTQPPAQTQNIPQSTLREEEEKKTLYCKVHLIKSKGKFWRIFHQSY